MFDTFYCLIQTSTKYRGVAQFGSASRFREGRWFKSTHPEQFLSRILFWWFGGGVTPVLIPNTEVKPSSGDGTPFGEE